MGEDAGTPNWKTILSTLALSSEYVSAWEAITERPLTFAEFSTLPMPPGCDSLDMWRHFTTLRRRTGIVFSAEPWYAASEQVSWAYVTRQTQHELEEISSLADPSSTLNTSLRNGAVDLRLIRFVIDELHAACVRDGLPLSKNDVFAIYLGQRTPSTPAERIVKNFCTLHQQSASFASRDLSLSMLDRIYEGLLEGVEGPLDFKRVHVYPEDVVRTDLVESHAFAERTLIRCLESARRVRTVRDAVISFDETSGALWDLDYFDQLDGLVELLLRRIAFLRWRIPVMSYVPFTHLAKKPSNHFDMSTSSSERVLASKYSSSEGLDITFFFSSTVHILLVGLREVKEELERLAQEDEKAEQALRSDESLNQRQKDFLTIANRKLGYEATLKGYAEMFGVVRATARSDLFGLVNKGYLAQSYENRTLIFTLVSTAT